MAVAVMVMVMVVVVAVGMATVAVGMAAGKIKTGSNGSMICFSMLHAELSLGLERDGRLTAAASFSFAHLLAATWRQPGLSLKA